MRRYFYRVRAVSTKDVVGSFSDVASVDVCSPKVGDLNGDGQVDGTDADVALRLYLGLQQPLTCSNSIGNVYQPGTTGITPRDALNILKGILN